MAFKSKVEKMVEFAPNNVDLAYQAYIELVNFRDSQQQDLYWPEAILEVAAWMHKYTVLGYKCLCYTIFYVSQGLTPSWLGGTVEPYFEPVSQPQSNNTETVIAKEPELDLSYFLNMVE